MIFKRHHVFVSHITSDVLQHQCGRGAALVPGFEPLELGLSSREKMALLKSTFNLPRQKSDFVQWKHEMMSMPRVDMSSLEYNHVMSAEAVGFKMRPYRTRGKTRPMRTGLSGISAMSFEKVLRQCNVTIIATVRKNVLLQALSWYRAHELQDSQFHVAGHNNDTQSLSDLPAVEQRQSQHVSGAYVNVRKFDKWLKRTQWANKELEKAIKFFDRPTMHFVYEDFLSDELSLLRRVAAFLGLPVENMKSSGNFFKNNNGNFRHLVQNWEELCDHLMHPESPVAGVDHQGSIRGKHDGGSISKKRMGRRKAQSKIAGVAELCH